MKAADAPRPDDLQDLDVPAVLRRERLLLVERLRGLPAAEWERPTACEGWAVRDVLAHLVTPFEVSAPAMALAVVRHRGIGPAMDAAARRLAAERDPVELLALLEDQAASTVRPPGLPLSAPLADVVAHSADVRHALGDPLVDWGAPDRLRPALDFVTSARAAVGFVPVGRLRGVALVAEDLGWRHGTGAHVHAPALLLLLAVLGRRPALQVLTGDGAQLLSR